MGSKNEPFNYGVNTEKKEGLVYILLNDHLPSFGKLKNSMLEEALVFKNEEMVQFILNNVKTVESSIIERNETNDNLIVPSQHRIVDVGIRGYHDETTCIWPIQGVQRAKQRRYWRSSKAVLTINFTQFFIVCTTILPFRK